MLQKAVGAAGFPSVHPESCWPWWKGPALELASSCCCCFPALGWEPARLRVVVGLFWLSWGDTALVPGQVSEIETCWDVLVALESEVSPGPSCW